MATLQSVNPYNGEVNAEFETLTNEQVTEKIEIAQAAYLEWKETSWEHRKGMFHKLADVMEADIEKYAKLQTIEMWMLYTESLAGMKGTVALCRWFADNAETYLWAEKFELNGTAWEYHYDSLWVIFGVGPWNFPFNQVLRAAIPNILAWNTQVYKHASNVPMCGAQIELFFHDAGFPEGIYTNLFVSSRQSEHIISNWHVRWVNLTGSEWAGSAVWALAWKYLKPSVLELGGNDALVLLDTTDIKSLIPKIAACRLWAGGQKCNSSKRFVVLDTYYDEFVEEMWKYVASQTIGDPMEATTTTPPLARKDLVDEVDSQVQKTISEGARLVAGGKIQWDNGQFFPATLLADITPEMTSYKDEIFGPVATVIKSSSVEESIRIANDSDFGLSSSVWGDDVALCKEVAAKLDGWLVFINSWVSSKPHLPFGWIRKSWYGKENGPDGLRAFTNKKVVLY